MVAARALRSMSCRARPPPPSCDDGAIYTYGADRQRPLWQRVEGTLIVWVLVTVCVGVIVNAAAAGAARVCCLLPHLVSRSPIWSCNALLPCRLAASQPCMHRQPDGAPALQRPQSLPGQRSLGPSSRQTLLQGRPFPPRRQLRKAAPHLSQRGSIRCLPHRPYL